MQEQRNTLPYGYPLEVSFKNTSNYDFDEYSGERTRTYGVVTMCTTEKYNQKIQYEVTVKYTRQESSTKQWIVQLSKTKVFINQASTDRMIDRLNESFMLEVLYPLEFIVSNSGGLIDIHNFDKLKARFKTFIKAKKKEYSGIYAERYFKLLEQKIKDKYTLQRSLQKDWFITSFFMPLYSPNGFLGNKKKVSNYFPSCTPFDPAIYYQSELKCPNTFVRPNIMEMHFNVENKEKKNHIAIDYELNATNFLINDIRAKAELKNNEIIVKTVTTTVQHLREKYLYKPKRKTNMNLKQRFYTWLDT